MAKKKKSTKPDPSSPVILPPEDDPTLLAAGYEKVARALANGDSARQAAFSAGFSENTGRWLSKHPQIKARVIQLKLQHREDLRKQSISDGIRVVPRVTIQRNDIINGLAAIAQDIKMQGRARVAAYLGLADIFMLRARNVKDLMDFYGWTSEEMDEYANTGVPPARIRSLLGESAFKALAEAASFRTEK